MNEIYAKQLFDIIRTTSNILFYKDIRYLCQLTIPGKRIYIDVELLDHKIKIKQEEIYEAHTAPSFLVTINDKVVSNTLGEEIVRLIKKRQQELTRLAEIKSDEDLLKNILEETK